MYVCIYIRMCVYVCMYVYTYACIYMCVCICVRVRMCVCVCMYSYIFYGRMYYFNMFTSLHFTKVFSSTKVLRHTIFIYKGTTLANNSSVGFMRHVAVSKQYLYNNI